MSSLFRIHTWSLQWPSCGYIQWLILSLRCIWPFHSIWPSVKMWVFCWCVFLFSLASSTPDRDGFIPTSLIHCLLFILIFFLGLYIPAYFVILECLQFSYRPSYLFCIYFLILSSRFLVYLYNIHGMMNPVQTFPELQTYPFNCLLDMTTWVSTVFSIMPFITLNRCRFS